MKKKKKKSVKKLIISIFLAVLLAIVAILALSIYYENININEKNTIIAIKTITEDEQKQIIKYTIKIKDYNIESAIKEITFETEQEAKLEYNRYQIINECERKEIGLELKKKKLILIMPEKQLLQDVKYNTQIIKTMTFENGEKIEIIDQNELKQCLKQQGYEIK